MSKRPPEKGKALVPANGADGSSKVPALKSTNFHINFLALTAALDEQVQLCEELCDLWRGRNKPVDLFHEVDDVWAARELWTSVREGAEQCLATMNALWTSRMPDPNIHSPSAEWLGWRIGEMTKAWGGNSKMSADEMLYMADRLEAENLHGMTWEGIFREIEDTRSKAPTINEVLEFLKKTKHIADWKRRLAAVDLANIRKGGEETVFALEFKKAVFEEAAFEYLDNHGHIDLAAEVREQEERDSYLIAIEATAKSEGLFELIAKMKMQRDYSPDSELIAKLKNGYSPALDNPWEQAQKILKNNKRVKLEWDLLFKNAQRHLNQDKAFACTGCGAGYDEEQCCMVCGCWLVVDHARWEQHIEQQQEKLRQQQKLESNLSRKQELMKKLVKHYNADRLNGGNDSDQRWMQDYINLEKPILPSKCFIEILRLRGPHWQTIPEVKGSEDEWIWEDEVKGIGYDGVYGTASAVLSFGNPLAYYEISNEFMSAGDEYDVTASGVHYLMTAVYENTEGRKLSLKTIIPYKYQVKQVMVGEKSISHEQIGGKDQVLTEGECKTLDQLLGIEKPTLDDQTQLSELIVKLYAAFLPPPLLIRNLRWAISQRIAQGRPRDPYEQLEYDLAEAEALKRQKAEEEAEARDRAEYEQSPQGQLEAWLSSLALRYHLMVVENFKYHGIDETVLPHLTHESLKELGIDWIGDRIKLLNAIAIRFPAEQSPVTDEDVEMHDE